MKTITAKEAWRLICTKKKDRTEAEQFALMRWLDRYVIGPAFRGIAFPIAFIIKVIKKAYDWTWDN